MTLVWSSLTGTWAPSLKRPRLWTQLWTNISWAWLPIPGDLHQIDFLQGLFGAISPKPTRLAICGHPSPAVWTSIASQTSFLHLSAWDGKTGQLKEYPTAMARGLAGLAECWIQTHCTEETSVEPATMIDMELVEPFKVDLVGLFARGADTRGSNPWTLIRCWPCAVQALDGKNVFMYLCIYFSYFIYLFMFIFFYIFSIYWLISFLFIYFLFIYLSFNIYLSILFYLIFSSSHYFSIIYKHIYLYICLGSGMRFKIQFPLTSWEPKSDQGILGPVHGIIRKNMMACQSWMVCEFEIETLFLRGSF